MNQLVKILFFVALNTPSWAQLPAEEPVDYLYKKDWYLGLQLSTNGFGGLFAYERNSTFRFKHGIYAYCNSIKGEKETRKSNSVYNDSKTYVYGKINLFFGVRLGYGISRLLYERKRERGVSIRFQTQIGPTLGIIKPIYLKIKEPYSDPQFTNSKDERYDPNIHHEEFIYGRSNFWKGVNESTFQLGAFAKSGFQFDFSSKTNKITAVEIGVQMDIFPKAIPLFYLGENKTIFPGFYAAVQLGKNKL